MLIPLKGLGGGNPTRLQVGFCYRRPISGFTMPAESVSSETAEGNPSAFSPLPQRSQGYSGIDRKELEVFRAIFVSTADPLDVYVVKAG